MKQYRKWVFPVSLILAGILAGPLVWTFVYSNIQANQIPWLNENFDNSFRYNLQWTFTWMMTIIGLLAIGLSFLVEMVAKTWAKAGYVIGGVLVTSVMMTYAEEHMLILWHPLISVPLLIIGILIASIGSCLSIDWDPGTPSSEQAKPDVTQSAGQTAADTREHIPAEA